jgi:hypothetical protein
MKEERLAQYEQYIDMAFRIECNTTVDNIRRCLHFEVVPFVSILVSAGDIATMHPFKAHYQCCGHKMA